MKQNFVFVQFACFMQKENKQFVNADIIEV